MAVKPTASKDHPENSPEGQQAKSNAIKADDSTAEVQKRIDEETKQGFRGIEADPTPNEAYSVQGVTSGQPTPETDDKAFAEAQQALADNARKATGVAER